MTVTKNNGMDALLSRVNEIVENAEKVSDMTISVEYHHDEVPTIHYDIKELVMPRN